MLHSSSNNRSKYWQDLFETKQIENSPETDEEKFKTIRKRHTVLTENQEDDISKYEYHVFKFSRIQSWIRKWSQDVQIGNITQNFIIGPSIMIESIFVRLRSFILKEYGVGSICIDGGGRFSFLSKQNLSHVRETIRNFLLKALLFDQDHTHPYNDLIEEQMKKYVINLAKENQAKWIQIAQVIAKDSEELEIVSKPDGDKFPWSRVIQYFIGEEQMEKWLPHYADEADSGLVDELNENLQPRTANKFRNHVTKNKAEDCNFCNFAIQEKIPKQPDSGNCHLMCPMHWLLFKIGRRCQDAEFGLNCPRNLALREEFGLNLRLMTSSLWMEIQSVDGFKKQFEWKYKNPTLG